MKRLLVLIGGNGSNLEAILKAIRNHELKLNCVGVISHREEAQGLKRAQKFNVPCTVVPHATFHTRDDFEDALLTSIQSYQPDIIALAGFMRILSPRFIKNLSCPMLNIHPSLLPKFRGLNTHQRALDAKETFTGATVHLVTNELDGGPILAQKKVPIFKNDTAQTLKQRVLQIEHELYIHVLQSIAQDLGAIA